MGLVSQHHSMVGYEGEQGGNSERLGWQPEARPSLYQFGDFSLDLNRAELRRRGERRDIQPLVLDLLAYLIANRGHVATKDELFQNVWGDDVSVVDTALTTAVCEARKAIDDDHVRQWAIRTVPRRGYRFIAPTAEGARVRAGSNDTAGRVRPSGAA